MNGGAEDIAPLFPLHGSRLVKEIIKPYKENSKIAIRETLNFEDFLAAILKVKDFFPIQFVSDSKFFMAVSVQGIIPE